MSQTATDTLIIGAGPYGLSLSAHLNRAGLSHKIVGKTMDAWTRMPRGMCLRSPARASSLSDPDGALTLERFASARGTPLEAPVTLESFIDYGRWFAERAGIEVDPRLVADLRSGDGSFVATLEDGDVIEPRRVVVAAGAEPFRWIPPEFRGLPPELVSHAGDHDDFERFSGKQVIVLGMGQSGVECAALAHESGAEVRLIARGPGVRWLTRSAWLHQSKVLRSLLYSPSDVGPAGLSKLVSAVQLFGRFPAASRDKMTARCARPAAAAWLVERTADIPFDMSRQIRSITPAGDRIRVLCLDGDTFEADHLLLATGYRVDVSQYSFIAPELVSRVKATKGSPVLRRGFLSSVPGLYFLGWPSVWSFGPLMRHVVGAEFSSRAVTAQLVATESRSPQPVKQEIQPASVA